MSGDALIVAVLASDLANKGPDIEAAIAVMALFLDDFGQRPFQGLIVFVIGRNWAAHEIYAVGPTVKARFHADLQLHPVIAKVELLGRSAALAILGDFVFKLGAVVLEKLLEGEVHLWLFRFWHDGYSIVVLFCIAPRPESKLGSTESIHVSIQLSIQNWSVSL